MMATLSITTSLVGGVDCAKTGVARLARPAKANAKVLVMVSILWQC